MPLLVAGMLGLVLTGGLAIAGNFGLAAGAVGAVLAGAIVWAWFPALASRGKDTQAR